MSAARRPERSSRHGCDYRRWLVGDVLLTLGMLAGIGIAFLGVTYWAHSAGAKNEDEPLYVPGAALGGAGGAFLILVIRVTLRWRSLSLRQNLFRAVFPLLGISALFLCRGSGTQGLSFLHGLQSRMEQKADIRRIRMWATANPGFTGRTSVCGLKEAEVRVSEDGESVELMWGGGFVGTWGLTVGPEGAAVPRGGLAVAPGAYVWRDPG